MVLWFELAGFRVIPGYELTGYTILEFVLHIYRKKDSENSR